jgi:hypothetical protein
MGTIANPAYTALVPGMNPRGVQIEAPQATNNPLVPTQSPVSSAPTSTNPLTAGTVPTFGANTGGGYPSSLNLQPPGSVPTTNVGAAAQSPIGGLSLMSPKDISRMFDSLKKTYGDGMAHAILDFLTSGAGFNQQAVNNLLASLQPGIERGTESLMEQFSTSGNRFGSGAQIGLGDFLSQVNLNEGQIISKMYEDSVNRYMDVLTGTGGQVAQTRANSPSVFDSILSGIGLGGAAGQGLSSIISAISPTADTGILDAISGAAAEL